MKAWKKGVVVGAVIGFLEGTISIPIGMTHAPTPSPSISLSNFESEDIVFVLVYGLIGYFIGKYWDKIKR